MRTTTCDICKRKLLIRISCSHPGITFTDGMRTFCIDACSYCMAKVLDYIGQPEKARKILRRDEND
jgi:hypothetical protein